MAQDDVVGCGWGDELTSGWGDELTSGWGGRLAGGWGGQLAGGWGGQLAGGRGGQLASGWGGGMLWVAEVFHNQTYLTYGQVLFLLVQQRGVVECCHEFGTVAYPASQRAYSLHRRLVGEIL